MANQKDKHLDAWLNSFTVDQSTARLMRLENAIMNEIETLNIDVFCFPSNKEWIGATSMAGLLATILVVLIGQVSSGPALDYSSIVMSGAFVGWGY